MKKQLNIAILADPELPIPPRLYGGIERIIDMLIKGYISQGHTVSLFAHKESVTGAKLYPYTGKTSQGKADYLKNAWLINKTVFMGKFDLIHSFGRLAYLLPQLPFRIPKLMSYQRAPTISQIVKAVKLSKPHTLSFTGCSDYISSKIDGHASACTIYNGVPLETFRFKSTVEANAPLVFLGRIEPIKGTHIAVKVAIKTGRKLMIAGNIPEGHADYFNTEIAPYINEHIEYVGAVNDIQKNELLGRAAALLMPIEWDEPFGIVMAEALACGTPVIGFNRGAVPEVIKHGVNGFICNLEVEMIEAVKQLNEINRENVRKDAEERFSAEVIVESYLKLYHQLINN